MQGGEHTHEQREPSAGDRFDLTAGLPPLDQYVRCYVTVDYGPRFGEEMRSAYRHYLLDASGLDPEHLTDRETEILTWLVGWDDYTVEPIGWLLARASGLTPTDGAAS